MRSSRMPLVLCLLLSATGCSTSSPPGQQPSAALLAAEAKVQAQLDHPLPPARLLQCQDGSEPQLIEGKWECPPPPDVLQAIQTAPLLELVAKLTGALRKEVDLRFQMKAWAWPAGAGLAASPAPPPKE